MTEPLLRIEGLTKWYGATRALDNLSLEVPRGVICGFVGANGAGKTTTYSVIGGFLKPKSGGVFLDGLELRQYLQSGRQIGILPQDMLFFENRTIAAQLALFAKLAGRKGAEAHREVKQILAAVGLEDKYRARPHELSRGMRVRLGIASALIGDPAIVLLDEPLAGLDPRMKKGIKDLILSLRDKTTFLISSHELGELEEICDYFCIINDGKLVKQGVASDILETSNTVVYKLEHIDGHTLLELKKTFPEFEFFHSSADVLELTYRDESGSVAEVNGKVLLWLLDHNIAIREVIARQSLEKAYLTMTD